MYLDEFITKEKNGGEHYSKELCIYATKNSAILDVKKNLTILNYTTYFNNKTLYYYCYVIIMQ